jgi:hypothetical protein
MKWINGNVSRVDMGGGITLGCSEAPAGGTDLDASELFADRVFAKVPPLLRRGFSGSVPSRTK